MTIQDVKNMLEGDPYGEQSRAYGEVYGTIYSALDKKRERGIEYTGQIARINNGIISAIESGDAEAHNITMKGVQDTLDNMVSKA